MTKRSLPKMAGRQKGLVCISGAGFRVSAKCRSWGHQRRFECAPSTSVFAPIPDVLLSRSKRLANLPATTDLRTEAWSAYLIHLNTPNPAGSATAQIEAWEARRNELLALLLVKIAAHLGISKGELEIMHGGYAPQGWAINDARVGQFRNTPFVCHVVKLC
jgi:hypothetical protein